MAIRNLTRRFPPARRHSLVLLALLGGCSQLPPPRAFNSVEYLRKEYAERVGAETAAQLPVPFQIDDAIVAATEGRIHPAASEPRRVEQVTDFIFGWLGLRYALEPTRTAQQTFEAKEGNCLSFVNLFVGIGRRYRLNPFYVEVEDYQRWNYDEGTVVSHGHIVAGLRVDGKLQTFDFLPYKAKSYRDFNPIDDLKAAAHYFNNLGAEALLRGDVDRALELTHVAVQLAPDFDKALNNHGVVLLREGKVDEALADFKHGLQANPTSVALLTNSVRAYQTLGRHDDAERILARLEKEHAGNPFLYIYRAEQALAHNAPAQALDYMREAYKRNSELPAVHVGLAKVYLALGDRETALHYVERALKLDATDPEARKLAALLLGTPRQGR